MVVKGAEEVPEGKENKEKRDQQLWQKHQSLLSFREVKNSLEL